jgi:DNA polymerase I-like protein with 3'-5' exonuclease and polymerase domains
MLIDTLEKFNSVKPSLLACTDPCVDTETTGLSIFGNAKRKRDVVIGISIDDGRDAYYFPFRHMQGTNLPIDCMQFFRKYLSDPNRTYGGFNYNYDLHMMAFDDIDIAPNFEDAMLAMHLVNENEPDFKLKSISDRYKLGDGSLQESILEDKVFEECQKLGLNCSRSPRAENNTKSMMYVLPPEDVEPYACDDVRLTRMLLDLLKPALKKFGLYDIWRQVNYYSYIICQMEHRGMHIDSNIIKKYQLEAVDAYAEAQRKLNEAAGFELNPNSPKKVCEFLKVKSSSAEVLADVIDAGGQDAENAKLVQIARGWKSVDSRYYTPYLESMDEHGDLHCSLNLIGTYTGRLSCSNPNLQAVAKHTDIFKVKDVFTARPGYIMIQADYKQAEMRLVTHYTKDQLMKELIENDADLHSETANRLGIPRQAAKRLNFSVIYGIGAKHLSESLRVEFAVAKDYLEKYHGLYPGFRKLMYQCEDFAKEYGYIELWTGRLRHFNVPSADPHKAMSNLIQGGVAEIVRVAISRLYPAMKDIGANMLMQVHDSIIFEVPEEQINIALPTIQFIMEDFDFDPKPGVDIEYGYSWGLFQKWKGEIIDPVKLPKP